MISKDAKYIVFDDGMNDIPVIFPNFVTHGNMALRFNWKPISAGFVGIEEDGTVVAYGESLSLGIKSDPKVDNKLLAKMFAG